jgi:hypothetical protein
MKNEWSNEMRRFLIVLAPLLASACILGVAAPAGAETYPICLAGGAADSLLCDYASLEQCRATASGAGGYCVKNAAHNSNPYASYRGADRSIH